MIAPKIRKIRGVSMITVEIRVVVCCAAAVVMLAGCSLPSARREHGGKEPVPVHLPNFRITPDWREQDYTFRFGTDVRIHINAPPPENFDREKRVGIVLYALPNGNTIEQTAGKTMSAGDDWHYDIQHIAAQTRFLRERIDEYNIVVAYLETDQRSWPAWKREHPDNIERIQAIVDTVTNVFSGCCYDTFLVLNGHSGGGSFIFGYIDGFDEIPDTVERIAFLDSDYNYNDGYGDKLAAWLELSDTRCLAVLAYNDSVALYNGKPVVSETGGTWHRSWMMKNRLAKRFMFTTREDSEFFRHRALDGRIGIILRKNPERRILHTVQVERNGFIHSMLSGTPLEEQGYTYYGDRVYSDLTGAMTPAPLPMTIPPRKEGAVQGHAFMREIDDLPFEDRERRIYEEISSGNMPSFLRRTFSNERECPDADGVLHTVRYEAMPDYLSVGSDSDWVRVPMGPVTAQRLADLFGATLPTRMMVDTIYRHATFRPAPVTYYPVGNNNELVTKFTEHHEAIERLREEAGSLPGDLTAGVKKDVVISNRITEPNRPGHVVIYGWHTPDGKAIQPLTNIHYGQYVDYSHGARLICGEVMVDGVPMRAADILADPVLYRILSDEDGVMVPARYDTLSVKR